MIAAVGRLLAPCRGKLARAVGAFVVKDSPIWLLPVITAAIVDIVVAGGPLRGLAWLGLGTLVLLALNVPMNLLFVRLFFGTSRDLGAHLRNALAQRLQSLSIGFHARSSAALIQSKVAALRGWLPITPGQEVGTHDELIAADGSYARMHRLHSA